MKNLFYMVGLAFLSTLVSCEEDDSNIVLDVTGKTGYYITNEGSWGNSNASIGFLSTDGTYYDDLFTKTNRRPLGDVLQSVCINGNKAYMVMNGSNKLEIINANTFEEKGTIEGFYGPRHMTVVSGTGYVTQWGDGVTGFASVKVVDLSKNTITKSLTTGNGPERMLVVGTNLLVANSGGYATDSTLTVINTTDNTVAKTVQLHEDNPTSMVTDKNGDIWVLCYGSVQYDASYNITAQSRSALVKLSGSTLEPIATYPIAETAHPTHLVINPTGDTVYYGGGYAFTGIYAMAINATETPSTAFIADSFYALSVNSATGEIIGSQNASFSTAGKVFILGTDGTQKSSVVTGIGTNSAIYKAK